MQSSGQFDLERFRRAWSREGEERFMSMRLRRYTAGEILVLDMPEEHVDVLSDVGIPEEAAPFLVFDDLRLPCSLEAYGFFGDLGVDTGRFVVIGFDGSSNPVVLDRQRPGCVLLIDGDQTTGLHVINTSIPRFLASLLAFRDFVDVRVATPAAADGALETLSERLKDIDPEAFVTGGLWPAEIEAQAGLLEARRLAGGWSFASARVPATFGAATQRHDPGTSHAFSGDRTLCGIPAAQVTRWRHLFDPDGPQACLWCQAHAQAAPTQPCGQERFHDRVLDAPGGPLRERLLEALFTGAEIRIWINGPADKMHFYAKPDRITRGAEAVRELLAGRSRLGVARIVQPSGEFVVLLPDRADPVIAWQPANDDPAETVASED